MPLKSDLSLSEWIKEIEGLGLTSNYEKLKSLLPQEKVKPMKTTTKYIPEEIINACAAAAYATTYMHYNDRVWQSAKLSDESPRLQKRVVKDVKAVLYGNRTPADLHEAWSHRKMVSCGYSMIALRKIAPTAAVSFGHLSKDDQRGYEVFVETVKATYQKLQKKKTGQPSGVRLFEYSTSNEVAGFGRTSSSERSLVEVYFDTFQEAQAFYNQLETNSK